MKINNSNNGLMPWLRSWASPGAREDTAKAKGKGKAYALAVLGAKGKGKQGGKDSAFKDHLKRLKSTSELEQVEARVSASGKGDAAKRASNEKARGNPKEPMKVDLVRDGKPPKASKKKTEEPAPKVSEGSQAPA